MSKKHMAPFHHHKSQIENLKTRRLDPLQGQQEHSAVCEMLVCVCVRAGGSGWSWLTWLLNAAPDLFVAFHDYSVSTVLKDARSDNVFV